MIGKKNAFVCGAVFLLYEVSLAIRACNSSAKQLMFNSTRRETANVNIDEDEIGMEQQERKRKAMLNKEIKGFAEKIAEASSMLVRC